MSKARLVFRVLLVLVLIAALWVPYWLWTKSKPEYFWSRAVAAEQAKDLEAAEIHLQALVRRFPDHGEGRKALAAVMLELAKKNNGPSRYARNDLALAQLSEAGKLRPDDLELQKELLAARLERQQWREAAETAKRVLKLEKDNPDALFAVARQAVKAKNPGAPGYLTRLGEPPDRAFQAFSLQWEHAVNRRDEAKQQEALSRASEYASRLEVDELLALPPLEQTEMVRLLVGGVAAADKAPVASQRAASALKVFEKYASKIEPTNAAVWNTLGAAVTETIAALARKHPEAVTDAEGLKLVERAAAIQESAVAGGATAPVVHYHLAQQKFTQGDYRRALEIAEKGLKANADLLGKLPAAQRGKTLDQLLSLRVLAAKSQLALRNFSEANAHAEAMLDIKGISKDWIGRAYVLAGLAASGQGRHEKSLELFRRAEGQLGQVPEVRTGLAAAHLALGQWKEALPHLNAVQAALNAKHTEEQKFLARQLQITQQALRWNQFRAHLALDQWKEALPHLQALQGTPLEARAHAMAGIYLASKNRPNEAQTIIEAARPKFPNDLTLIRVQLELLRKAGKTDEAEQLVEQVAQAAPNELDKQLLLVQWRIRQGQREEALALIDQLRQRFADAASLQFLQAQTLVALGKRDEALQLAEALRKSPQTEALGNLIAMTIDFQENDLTAVAQQLERMAEQDPDIGAVRLLQGQVAAAQGDYESALDSLGEALDVTQLQGQARLALLRSILLLAEQKGLAEAHKALEPLIAERPDDPFLLTVQADLLFKQGEFEKGMALLDRLEQLQPQSAAGPYVKAGVWLQRGNVSRALVEAERALSLEPEHVPSLTLAAQLNLASGQPEAARERAQQIIKKNPQAWNAYLVLADALARLKQNDKAAEVLERVIANEPQFVAAHRALAALHAANQDLAKALEVTRQAQTALPGNLLLAGDEIALLCRQNQVEQAQAVAERAAGEQPNADAALVLARVFSSAGQTELARQWGEKAMAAATEEQKPLVHLFLGEVALMEDASHPDVKKKEEAREHFAAVLEANPNHFVAGNNLAWLLATEFNQPQEAAAIVDRVRGKATVSQMPLNFIDTLAVVYREAGRPADAEAVLKEALALAPENAVLLYHRGLALADLRRFAAARNDLEQALSLGLAKDKASQAERTLATLPTSSGSESQP